MEDASTLAMQPWTILGIACCETRLAVVLENATQFQLYEWNGTQANPVGGLNLPAKKPPANLISLLAAHGVTHLLCGAVSAQQLELLRGLKIQCQGWLCGEVVTVVEALVNARLDQVMMPGILPRQMGEFTPWQGA